MLQISKNFAFLGLAAAFVTAGIGARAQAAEDSGTSDVAGIGVANGSSTSTWDALKSKTSVEYYGVYGGPALAPADSSFQSDAYGKARPVEQNFVNYLMLGYKASDDIAPGITVLSTYTPVRGQGFEMLDPYLRVTDARLIHTGGLNLFSELRYFVPVTAMSHNLHSLGMLGTFQALTYDIAHTPLTVGAWAAFYWTAYGTGATRGIDYQAYLRPDLYYRISPKLQASIFYEMYSNHLLNQSWNNWDASGVGALYGLATDLQTGVMWNFMPGLTLNPYLQFATGGKVAMDTTAIGAQIFATIL